MNPLRKEILGLFTGATFEIRKVKLRDYIATINELPFPVAMKTIQELDKLSEKVRELPPEERIKADQKIAYCFLSKGIVRIKYAKTDENPDPQWQKPNIWYGEDDLCPEGMTTVEDLGSDADTLAEQIATFSFQLGAMPALAGIFRKQISDADAGSSGEPLPSAAIGAASEGNGAGHAEVLVRPKHSSDSPGSTS